MEPGPEDHAPDRAEAALREDRVILSFSLLLAILTAGFVAALTYGEDNGLLAALASLLS